MSKGQRRFVPESDRVPSRRRPLQGLTYIGKHDRVRADYGLASLYACVDCGNPAAEWSIIDPDADTVEVMFQPRCVPCHTEFDLHLKPRGESHVQSKLTDAQRRGIRASVLNGLSDVLEYAERLGVSKSLIYQIRKGGQA